MYPTRGHQHRVTHSLLCFAILVVAFALVIRPGRGELIPSWSYEELAAKSDSILIVELLASNIPANKSLPFRGLKLRGIYSKFKVRATLKGKATNTIRVLHYVRGKNIVFSDGSDLVEFSYPKNGRRRPLGSGQRKGEPAKPLYLVFLTKQRNGMHVFTSGPLWAGMSVKTLGSLKLLRSTNE